VESGGRWDGKAPDDKSKAEEAMKSYVESRNLHATHQSGKQCSIIAERAVIPAVFGERHGAWSYRLEDGRDLVPGVFGLYMIKQDGTKVTTTDPNEPKD
jgi:hypothetical protein